MMILRKRVAVLECKEIGHVWGKVKLHEGCAPNDNWFHFKGIGRYTAYITGSMKLYLECKCKRCRSMKYSHLGNMTRVEVGVLAKYNIIPQSWLVAHRDVLDAIDEMDRQAKRDKRKKAKKK